jgi:hypothetical protein
MMVSPKEVTADNPVIITVRSAIIDQSPSLAV